MTHATQYEHGSHDAASTGRLDRLWMRLLDAMLHSLVREGALRVTLPDGTRRLYGDGPAIGVHIHDWPTLRALAARPDPAMGEAYMDGRLTIEGDDLEGFLTLVQRNIARPDPPVWRRAQTRWRNLRRRVDQANPLTRARQNVAHHYDLSADLYDLFLDPETRQYSCAYFRTPEDSLAQAQVQKIEHIARKLRLEPGMRVLDIGCGWGGLGLHLAQHHGVRVTGVTLSREQHAHAQDWAAARGLSDLAQFHLRDYREVEGPFDRIVSVGMFEHVGAPHFREYFRHVERLLSGDGVALIHTIGRLAPPGSTSPWLAKYIFPGGYTPALSEMHRAIEATRLWTLDVEVWRLHYAETLRHWHDRFMDHEAEARRLYDDRFVRMWRFYLKICELAFRNERQAVFQVQLGRRRDAVPLSRDYLHG